MTTRRTFLAGTAALGGITMIPYALRADGHSADAFETAGGVITIYPISHASFVMDTPAGVIYNDPVGEASAYADLPPADLIMITHKHGDHYKPETLEALKGADAQMITNPEVLGMLPDSLKSNTSAIGNGESASFGDVGIQALPAHNLTEERLNFHPPGRDNGYVLDMFGFRTYISGDTEDIPEMRALKDIDLAFVCMNLPFTMDVNAAASAVNEFAPKVVYPYHYRGRDNGTQDPMEFANQLADGINAKMGPWYG